MAKLEESLAKESFEIVQKKFFENKDIQMMIQEMGKRFNLVNEQDQELLITAMEFSYHQGSNATLEEVKRLSKLVIEK